MPRPSCARVLGMPLACSAAPMPPKVKVPASAYNNAMPNSRKAEPAADSTMYLMPPSSERLLKNAYATRP